MDPLSELWRIPLGPPPTPSWPFVDGPLSIFLPFPSWKSFLPFLATLGFSNPLESLSSFASSNPLVALRRSSWPFVEIFLPFRGNSFSAWRSLAGPSRAFSNPFVDNSFPLRALRGFLFLGLGGAAKRRQHFAVGVSRSQAIGGWPLTKTFPTIAQRIITVGQ